MLFEKNEYKERLKKVKSEMQKKGIDLFLWVIPLVVLLFGIFTYWSLYKTIRFRTKGEQS